ncbi:MAG: hypothetical protein JXR50_06290 [Prolixibacteraceae bacterium]|nr:hypothetical protein [Prolixibacteraceae bacterium]
MSGAVKYLNGLGLVASGKRKIKPGNEFDKFFAPPKREDKYLTYAGTTNDTIGFMADIIKNTLADTKQIASVLKGNDLNSTLRNVFNFIFGHIQYKPDDPTTEELRRPVRVWADRSTGVDCDCYSIFIGSILSNLNIPFALRMVKISGRSYYQHVYVVVPKDGSRRSLENRANYFTVDPVLDTYNEEHPFTEKFDLFMQPIKYLNGVPSVSLNGLQGGHRIDLNNLYYSEEAASDPRDVVFFDGIDYYERVNGLNGLNVSGINGLQGLNGLGFLKKVWGAVKSVGKGIKNITKKAVKKITVKKDGSKTGIAKIFSADPAKKAERQAKRLERKEARQLKTVSAVPVSPASITPLGTSNPSATPTAKEMIDIANSMDKSMGVDSILNVVRAAIPDNTLVSQIIDAKAQANKGLSTYETRMLANDAAKAQEAEITKNVLDQVYKMKQFEQPQQAGMFGNMNMATIIMLVAGMGLTAFIVSRPRA